MKTHNPLEHVDITILHFRSLARRAGESTGPLQQILARKASPGLSRIESDFRNNFIEKDHSYSWPMGEKLPVDPIKEDAGLSKGSQREFKGGTRELRQLPFELETFGAICKKFHIHSSISRVISRADVPLFSRAEVRIGPEDSKAPKALATGIYKLGFLLGLH